MTHTSAAGAVLGEDTRHDIQELLRRVKAEFLEMPGMRLTEAQGCRLWGVDTATCAALLGALVDAKFLFRTRDGLFLRIDQAMPAKARVPSHATRVGAA